MRKLYTQITAIVAAGLMVLAMGLAGCSYSFQDFAPLEKAPKPFSKEALNFLAVGDWGRNGWFRQDNVAKQMGVTGAQIETDFVISTGDNFYRKGVTSITDGQWQRSFEHVYTASSLYVPWYPVAGNHDYRGNVEALIKYSAVSERWTMPARYYSIKKSVDDTTDALFVFLDTVALVRGKSISTPSLNERWWNPDLQYRWLDSLLTASRADWTLIVGHHPIHSASAKHKDLPQLRDRLLPILKKHGVEAYINGHVHSLQHLQRDGIHYFTSGAGSLARSVSPVPETQFAAGVSGFMAASLTSDTLQVQFIDYKGTVGYATALPVRTSSKADTAIRESSSP